MTAWRTSSYSAGNGACVQWRRSSRCESGLCVEVADQPDGVQVRDSKNPHGPVLSFDAISWHTFIAALKAGELAGSLP